MILYIQDNNKKLKKEERKELSWEVNKGEKMWEKRKRKKMKKYSKKKRIWVKRGKKKKEGMVWVKKL